MKKLVLFAGLLACTLAAGAQVKKSFALTFSLLEFREALIDAKQETLDKLTMEALSYGHSNGKVDDKKTFIEKIVSGQSDFVSIDITDETLYMSGKTAIVRHTLKARTNDGGNPGEVQLKVLMVWKKKGRSWKLLARQAVKFS